MKASEIVAAFEREVERLGASCEGVSISVSNACMCGCGNRFLSVAWPLGATREDGSAEMTVKIGPERGADLGELLSDGARQMCLSMFRPEASSRAH